MTSKGALEKFAIDKRHQKENREKIIEKQVKQTVGGYSAF